MDEPSEIYKTVTHLAHYRLEARLGKGGMAEVWKAFNTHLKRYEAVKIITDHLSDDFEFLTRFRQEAERVAGLSHPNIVTMYSVSPPDATPPYFAMEYVEGEPLSARMRAADGQTRRAMPLSEALPLLKQAAEALDYAHARGIIHRDIKPDNLMVRNADGVVKVVDFGIARILTGSDGTRLTNTGHVLGTARYLAPEQADPQIPQGPAIDQYALGVVAYEMLTGRFPYNLPPGATFLEYAMAHVRQEPLPPRQVISSLPATASAAVLRALSKNPADRFPSCTAFANALAASNGGTKEKPAPRPGGAKVWAIAAGVMAVGTGGVLAFTLFGGKTPATKTTPTLVPSATPAPKPTLAAVIPTPVATPSATPPATKPPVMATSSTGGEPRRRGGSGSSRRQTSGTGMKATNSKSGGGTPKSEENRPESGASMIGL